MAQIWRIIKQKVYVTYCFTTHYTDFDRERGILYRSTTSRNLLMFKWRFSEFRLYWAKSGAALEQDMTF